MSSLSNSEENPRYLFSSDKYSRDRWCQAVYQFAQQAGTEPYNTPVKQNIYL